MCAPVTCRSWIGSILLGSPTLGSPNVRSFCHMAPSPHQVMRLHACVVLRAQLGAHPLFQRLASLGEHRVFTRGKEVAEDLRERWETSDSPLVQRIQARPHPAPHPRPTLGFPGGPNSSACARHPSTSCELASLCPLLGADSVLCCVGRNSRLVGLVSLSSG